MTDIVNRLLIKASYKSAGITCSTSEEMWDAAAELERLLTALRRICSLEEKNVPKYAQKIAREALSSTPSTGRSPPVLTGSHNSGEADPSVMPDCAGGETSSIRKIETEARRYAEMYPLSSDGRNTFTIFADWVSQLPSTTRGSD